MKLNALHDYMQYCNLTARLRAILQPNFPPTQTIKIVANIIIYGSNKILSIQVYPYSDTKYTYTTILSMQVYPYFYTYPRKAESPL